MIFENLDFEINKLYKYCLKLSESPWMAEDLVQETLLKVCRLKKEEPERQFTYSFLCVVAKNLFIDEKRKNKNRIAFNEDLYDVYNDAIEYYSLIEVLLSTLPLRQAMLITLKDVFRYTSKEIASMLRVSNESIKTAIHRSRKKLKSVNIMDREILTQNQGIVLALSRAIQESKPMQIFYYYRILESQNFKVKRSSDQSVFYVIDPDGNILELVSQ